MRERSSQEEDETEGQKRQMGLISPDPDLCPDLRQHTQQECESAKQTRWPQTQLLRPHSGPWTDPLQPIERPSDQIPHSTSARKKGRGGARDTEVCFGKITFPGNQEQRRAFSPIDGAGHMSAHSPDWRAALSAFLPLSPCGKGM